MYDTFAFPKLDALSQQLDNAINSDSKLYNNRDARRFVYDTRCVILLLSPMISWDSKLAASSFMTQLSTRFKFDTCPCWCDDSAKFEALS